MHAGLHRALAHRIVRRAHRCRLLDVVERRLLDRNLRLRALMPGHRTNADLHESRRKAFLHDARERARVRIPVTLDFLIEIGVSVDVEHGAGAMGHVHRAHDMVRHGMVAT